LSISAIAITRGDAGLIWIVSATLPAKPGADKPHALAIK